MQQTLPLRHKVTENKSNDNTMELKKLKPQSLGEALRDMAVGETCVAPDGYTVQTVRKAVHDINATGKYVFISSLRSGVQTITRLS